VSAEPRAHPDGEAPAEVLSPFDVMDAPELAALALLEHAIDVARVALLAQHVELLDPDAACQREAQPGDHLTAAFFARAYELAVVIRRYRAAVAQAAAGLDNSPAHRNRGCRADDDL
jgi:hypothetical protein